MCLLNCQTTLRQESSNPVKLLVPGIIPGTCYYYPFQLDSTSLQQQYWYVILVVVVSTSQAPTSRLVVPGTTRVSLQQSLLLLYLLAGGGELFSTTWYQYCTQQLPGKQYRDHVTIVATSYYQTSRVARVLVDQSSLVERVLHAFTPSRSSSYLE